MLKSKALILLPLSVFFLLIPNPNTFAENITITTYYPAPYGVYKEIRSQRMGIGDTYYDNSNVCWGTLATCPAGSTIIPIGPADPDVSLVVEGNVGIGTVNPTAAAAPNGGTTGNLDVNDVWLRGANGGAGGWASAAGGGPNYESNWALLCDHGTHTFTHNLGYIPIVVVRQNNENMVTSIFNITAATVILKGWCPVIGGCHNVKVYCW